MKNFNGYGLFYNIRNKDLRTYNRINVYLNVRERHGNEVAKNYLKKFNRKEQWYIYAMLNEMKQVGYEQYRRDVLRARG